MRYDDDYDFENMKYQIRQHYKDEYVKEARKQNPVLKQAQEWLGGIGVTLGVVGVAGLIASFIFTAGMPFWLGAGAALAAGLGVGAGSEKVGNTIDKAAVPLLEEDVKNFKLVRRYIKEVLGKEQQALNDDRTSADNLRTSTHKQLDKKQADLDARRKVALKLVSQGLDALEGQARDVAKDVELFRQEAGQELGPEFASAVKPVVAEPTSGIVRGPSQRPMHS